VRAKGLLTWTKPSRPPNLGCAAWRNWSYQIFFDGIQNPETSDSESFPFIPEPEKVYRVRVRPVSAGGEGPVSDPVSVL
jgi:hypothetical protein